MRTTWPYILFTIIASVLLTSCSDDEYYQYGDFRFDMVTYTGYDNEQGAATYINYPAGDNAPQTLIDRQYAPTDLQAGSRILLNYIIDSHNSDGTIAITTRGYTQAFADSLRYTPIVSTIPMDSISLYSIWRTGNYINLHCRVKYTDSARLMALLADYKTINDDTVHCYLMHNTMGAQVYFWRRCYASFDISSVWNLQSCKTVRIHINDVAYRDQKYYDFTKTN